MADAQPGGAGAAQPAVVWPGYVLMALVALSWGFHWPLNKFALPEIPPMTYRAAGVLFAGVVLLAIARLNGSTLVIPKGERLRVTICAMFNIAGFHGTVAYGLYLMQASHSIIIAYTYPIWMVLLGRIVLGERITATRTAALVLGLAALVILFYPADGRLELPILGTAIMVVNALMWTAGTLYYKAHRWSLSTLEMVGWQMLIGAVPLVIVAAVFEDLPAVGDVPTSALLALVYSMIVAQALAHWAWFRALDYLSAVVASLITLVNPVIGVLASAWIVDEPITGQKLVALACAVAALTITVVGSTGRGAPRHRHSREGGNPV